MKILILIISFFILTFSVQGQTKKRPIEKTIIDTLSVKNDSILAKILIFADDSLKEENIAFLLPDSFQVPRFRLLKNYFIRTFYVSRILRHGKTIKYLANGNKKVIIYVFGKATYTLYLDKNNFVITEDIANKDRIVIGPCGELQGEYIFIGTKKE